MVIALGGVVAPGLAAPPQGLDYRQLERRIVQEINRARRTPQDFVAELVALRRHYRGSRLKRPSGLWVQTREGLAAVDEAIGYVAPLRPRRGLVRSRSLRRAAAAHVADQGRFGGVGHRGNDGSTPRQRLLRVGRFDGAWSESLSYGPRDAVSVVTGLVVDDGVASRSHRRALFDGAFRFVAVACGPHPELRVVCAVLYAEGWRGR